MTQVLVTGCLGYIGPVVTRRLHEAGHRVIGLDLGLFTSQHASMPEWPDSVFFGDIREGTGALAPVVVHLAGLSNDPMGELDPELTTSINIRGTIRLIREMARSRHIFVSSCAVYGAQAKTATEETRPRPLTTYARGKAMVDGFAPEISRNVLSLRLGTVYGPSPGHRLDLVVNRMVYDATHGNSITVNGSAWRPFTHVEDVADAIVAAVESDITGIRNVVGQNMRIDTLGKVVALATGASVTINPENADARDYRAKTLYSDLPRPERTIATSLVELRDFSRELPGDPDRYVRIHTLRRLIESGRLTAELKEPVAA